MFRKLTQEIYTAVWPESRQERFFLLAAFCCNFFISVDYAIVRPASNSIFLSFFPSTILPYIWCSGLPLNFLLVSLYNRYLPKLGCWRIFLCIIAMIMVGNFIGGLFLANSPWLSVFHFIWKEIYILLLFQTLWSLIHMTVSSSRAKAVYGIMFGIGGMASMLGSFVPGFCAHLIGSEALLFLDLPIMLLLAISYRKAVSFSEPLQAHSTFHKGGGETASLNEGIKLITRSRILPYILLIVLFMQITATLVDYQFNAFLQEAYPVKNLRTEFLGLMGSIVNFSSVSMQFVGSFLLMRLVGLRGTHFFVPIVLACNAVGSLIWPGLRMLTFSFASIKVFDFSLFGITKEMLYLRLSPEEKFQAKALIDVFAYRGAKALAAMVILGLQAAHLAQLHFLSWVCLIFFAVWCLALFFLFRREFSSASANSKF
jgi:ATP:ADP antiporter, AAA family